MLQDFKSEIKTFVIVAVIAVVVSVGGILLLKTLQPAPSPTPGVQQTPPPAPSPQPQIPDTSNWQTYRNEEFGFEVKYPADQLIPDWEIPSTPKKEIISRGILWFRPKTTAVEGEIASPEIFIVVSREILEEKLFPASYIKTSQEKINVAGKDVWKEAWKGDGAVHIVTRVISDSGTYYRAQGAFSTAESYEKYASLYDQILSTFRFTPQ